MEQFVVYCWLKSILKNINNNIKVSYNDMNFNDADVCGIYIKGADIAKYRELGTGEYLNNTCRCEIVVQGGLTSASLFEIMSFISSVRDTLILASNRLYKRIDGVREINGAIVRGDTTVGNDVGLFVSAVNLLSEVNYLGKTEQGRPLYNLNIKLNYKVMKGD